MAGGTWTTPNKVRPGVYTQISSQEQPIGRVGERGLRHWACPFHGESLIKS